MSGRDPLSLTSEPQSVRSSYRIVEYDLQWPVLYQDENARIVEALAIDPDRVEHIGSTAVPGLGAKPIVDMIVGIPFIPQGITRVSMSDHWTETILFRDYLRSNLEMR